MTKDNTEKALEAIEIAKASGKIKKGTNEVTKIIEKQQAKLVVVAKDVSPPEVTMHIPVLCKEKGVPCVIVNSKEELGAAAGLEVGTASVAVTNEGEAKKHIQEIADSMNVKEAPSQEKAEAPKEEKKKEKTEKKEEPKKEEPKEEKKE